MVQLLQSCRLGPVVAATKAVLAVYPDTRDRVIYIESEAG